MTPMPPALPARRRPDDRRDWRRGLVGTPLNTAITILTLAFLGLVVPPFLRWAILDATWMGTAADCKAGAGACWAFVTARLDFILYVFYPPVLHWRAMLVVALLLALLVFTAFPRN